MDYYSIKSNIESQGFSDKDLPLTYTNENDEYVILERSKQGDEEVYILKTAQKNDWIRVNVYYQNGTAEEYYER